MLAFEKSKGGLPLTLGIFSNFMFLGLKQVKFKPFGFALGPLCMIGSDQSRKACSSDQLLTLSRLDMNFMQVDPNLYLLEILKFQAQAQLEPEQSKPNFHWWLAEAIQVQFVQTKFVPS